jgi:signal transduction histidine kinase
MMERLEQGFNQTRQFSTDVSHELRTPLTAIRGQLEVALLAATTPAQYREAILTALEDVERLSQTIRALLLLSHAESGQTALQLQRLDLAPLIEHLVDEFQIPAEGAGLRLTASLPAACVVDADKIQMERLISNLLSNAIKYTQAGGEVHVTLMPGNPEVTIVIEDTGVGIAEDHLPHIFDRFYRVPTQQPQTASSPERGLGLGLSFVAWIVKAHRGRIDVESAPGKGTRFTILLPANTGVRVPEPAAQVASRST